MRILVDMDDTIEMLIEELVKRTNRKYHQNVAAEDVKDWSIAPAFDGLTKQQILDTADEPDFWRSVKPVPGAAEVLKHFMDEGLEYDRRRDAYLKSLGLTVVRYANSDINDNFDGVCEDILRRL